MVFSGEKICERKPPMTLRAFIVGLIVFILFIPSMLVFLLINDRENTRDKALRELNHTWGLSQTVTGPILSVPYTVYAKDSKNNIISSTEYAHFLPETLNIKSTVQPQKRYRGIYEVIVYESTVNVDGHFTPPDFSELGVDPKVIDWKNAFLSLGVSDMKGIREFISFQWNGQSLSFNPGLKSVDLIKSGLSEHVPITEGAGQYAFNFQLQLNGSESLGFSPLGKTTIVDMQSPWANPSFSGDFLPDDRKVNDKGFTAHWKVLHLNRNFPQKWLGTNHSLGNTDFGVKFFMPVDHYQKVSRAAKYAIMFLGLTFLALFIIEVLRKTMIHPLQYILVGVALVIFYTLLLSLAEHIPFGWAYLISSVVIVGMITGYIGGILTKGISLYVGGVLTLLYLYLYIVLQLEDYALLIGSLGLVVTLGVVMYLTRKIDWYAVKKV